jgi:hypothetical protein
MWPAASTVCGAGPFQVVFFGLYNTNDGCVAYAHVSSPEVVKWSRPCYLDFVTDYAVIVDSPLSSSKTRSTSWLSMKVMMITTMKKQQFSSMTSDLLVYCSSMRRRGTLA